MSKIYNIPLSRGYAASRFGPEIPVGYWTGKNMIYREDGALCSRYTYKFLTPYEVGSSSSAHIMDISTNQSYIYAICSDGKPYYKAHSSNTWTACNWTGSGGAPTIDNTYRGEWGCLNGYTIYTNVSNYPLKFSGTDYDYLTGGTADSYCCNYLAEHRNQLLLTALTSNGSSIRFSNIDNQDAGYTDNYVNVGDEGESIHGIHSVGGNLVVIKQNSIWAKLGSYSEMSSGQFQPVIRGIYSTPHCSTVGRDTMYYGDEGGVFAFSGGDIKLLSAPISYDWQNRQIPSLAGITETRMGYWIGRDWLWIANGTSYDKPMVYDARRDVWYRFEDISLQCMNNFRGEFYMGMYGSSNCANVFTYGSRLNEYGAQEASIAQELQTPLLDLDNPLSQKYLRKIYLYASSVDQVDVYFKTSPMTPSDLYITPSHTILFPANGETLHFDADNMFRQISLKLTGHGGMVVHGLAVEYDERR